VTKTVAIVGTGAMGSAVGRCLVEQELRVVTALDDRSALSRELAASAGIEDAGSLDALVDDADMLLSIMPPAAAKSFAAAICPLMSRAGRDALLVDCNAVSPDTLGDIATIAKDHEVRFHDVGIVGAAPRPDRNPVRFYASGKYSDDLMTLAAPLIEIRPLGDSPGRASAFKMVYASLTKGTSALRAAALIAGEALGVGDEIRKEWQQSVPDAWRVMADRMDYFPSVAGRWTGEMQEIAATYASVGLTPAFHEGAAAIYALLAQTDVKPGAGLEAALDAFMQQLASQAPNSGDR
jgi:3-hydroxyisobutyrate dehydrogenase-like beta-hydroxyacid dehydrogenase